MKASIVDLRYKMNDIMRALERNESVTILYHGKEKGIIIPSNNSTEEKVKNHPFFGMLAADDDDPVDEKMRILRGNRYEGEMK